MYVEAKIRYS